MKKTLFQIVALLLKLLKLKKLRPRISLIGVGGGGGNALKTMVEQGLDGVELFAVNTDVQDLENLSGVTSIPIGSHSTQGMGAGADPKVGKKAASFAKKKLGSQHLKSQKCPVIFIPRQASGLFSQLLGALSGSRQFKKTSFLLDSLDKSVITDSISIYEDPLQSKTLGSRAFDLDGVLKNKQFFVEDGRVVSYLMGQYSANQLGLKTTANAGGVSNCYVKSNFEGGLDELTRDMKKGLIVTDLMGHGVNATTGDYSRGASGFWVENGAIQFPVSGITIAGNLKNMLKNIVFVGNDFDFRSNVKVGSTLISEMTIAGEG